MPFFRSWIGSPTSSATTTSGLYTALGTGTATTTATTLTSTARDHMVHLWLANQTAGPTLGTASNTVWWSSSNEDEWETWVDNSTYLTLARQRVVVSQEQRAEMLRLQAEQQRRAAEQEQERRRTRDAATARSKELLLSHLTPTQRETFQKNRWFVVEGGRSRQLYRIRDSGSYSANIDVLEGRPGKVTHRLCCHLRSYEIPLYDHLLAQKVWIERDEDQFLRTANRHAA